MRPSLYIMGWTAISVLVGEGSEVQGGRFKDDELTLIHTTYEIAPS
ncbi:hypothetical protein IIA79_07865 [bacterium]|nr:hypothetical protein [bacterium]